MEDRGDEVFCFQAEDGIRDGHVTGVQTCALPISRDLVPLLYCESSPRSPRPRACKHCFAACRQGTRGPSPPQSGCAGPPCNIFPAWPEKSCHRVASERVRTARGPGCSEKRERDKPGPWSLRNRFVPPRKPPSLREHAGIPNKAKG